MTLAAANTTAGLWEGHKLWFETASSPTAPLSADGSIRDARRRGTWATSMREMTLKQPQASGLSKGASRKLGAWNTWVELRSLSYWKMTVLDGGRRAHL